MRPRRSFAAAACATVALCFTAAGAAPAAQADSTTFYTTPASVPSTPGTLMRAERYFSGLSLLGTPTRIMYSSTDDNGKPVAVTGTYIEPWAKWSGGGDRPLVTYTVGSIGQGDQCAPSKLMASAISLQTFGSLPVNYEGLGINGLLAKGVAVVVTDYVGLGLPDRAHTYMNRLDQGHAALDAARVARNVAGSTVTANSKVGTFGYSQGGGGSSAALELADSYAPELKMAAGYVGAPPADLEQVLAGVDKSPIVGMVGWFINGAAEQHPFFKEFVDANVSDKGKAVLSRVSTQCTVDTTLTYGYQSTTNWTNSGEPLSVVMGKSDAVTAYVRSQKIGNVAPTVPVRVATGVTDDIVPHAQARQLAVDWCARGANVTYAPLQNPSTGPKSLLNHATPAITDQSSAISYVVDRFLGKPIANNCAQLPSMQ